MFGLVKILLWSFLSALNNFLTSRDVRRNATDYGNDHSDNGGSSSRSWNSGEENRARLSE